MQTHPTPPSLYPAQAEARRILLERVYNLRDIGGYPTIDGRRTKWRTLFRSDSLHRLTPAGRDELLNLGLRTVIDLRYREELAGAPNVFKESPHVHYRPIALYELDDPAIAERRPENLDEVYRLILAHGRSRLKQILEALTEPGALPGLVHCTAGKDRTGVVIALLLCTLGVPDDIIVEDFALSGAYAAPILDELRMQAAREGWDMEWYNRLLESDPAIMRRTLAHLREAYGGATAYWRAAGVADEQLERLRAALLE
ncbi:MAG: tyrosine-protein phosphatase [Anaerolineae bacterium]|nr:tyrosine-protein phosphatase [Thermoflexales bacterium]MDW8406269.1 tyrosine-protein phosphatase [Anaerolineae bacterium]